MIGERHAVVIPSCVVWSIIRNYPSENGVYTEAVLLGVSLNSQRPVPESLFK